MQTSRADDIQVLEMLHLRDGKGWTSGQIAERFGVSRNSVIGKVTRCDRAHEKVPCKCRRKINRDGGMKPKWWA